MKIKTWFPPAKVLLGNQWYIVGGMGPHHMMKIEENFDLHQHKWIQWLDGGPFQPKLVGEKKQFELYSLRTREKYTITRTIYDTWICTCMEFSYRKHCKHIDQCKEKV